MTFKKLIGKLHLWLGLTSGLLVLFLGVTGCILAFQREIENTVQSYRYVAAENKPMLPPSAIQVIAEKALPGKHPHSVTYQSKADAVQVAFYNADPEYYYIAYINPYSGEVLKVKDMNSDFFRIVIMGHYYLWLPPAIGQPIVASATLVFLIMMISGLILWWPKSKAASKQRFSIKWNAKWRRVNYDLHNVLGFYMTWVTIFIAITGLVWGFQWFAKGLYWTTSGGKSMVDFYEPLSTKEKQALFEGPAVDKLWNKMNTEHPNAAVMDVHFPSSDSTAIEVAINPERDTYWKADYRYFDQYTLQEVSVKHLYGRFQETSVADKIARMNYDVHVGAILGLAGKIMAFCGSLIAASLPVTGFMIWRGRRKKESMVNRKEGRFSSEVEF
ncbi:peptidase M4 [Solitalea longa]|uniref:Peptidase M4 n=1 Tax=Solitalea longa TaxID=2079460 RepID=A0A2S4ZYB8_9SPHI|nr:PepSY-associated TM helix domain-containing protein [Solitalea longa]POY35276.1 peptidase M4 [Solitalea longa]